jgi:hypothetical protein
VLHRRGDYTGGEEGGDYTWEGRATRKSNGTTQEGGGGVIRLHKREVGLNRRRRRTQEGGRTPQNREDSTEGRKGHQEGWGLRRSQRGCTGYEWQLRKGWGHVGSAFAELSHLFSTSGHTPNIPLFDFLQ